MHSGYGITLDRKGSWSFANYPAKIVISFYVDNSSWYLADNHKNNLLILGEDPTFGINEGFGSPEKNFSINFSKAITKFCLSLHYNGNNNYLIVKKSVSLKLIIERSAFQLSFV